MSHIFTKTKKMPRICCKLHRLLDDICFPTTLKYGSFEDCRFLATKKPQQKQRSQNKRKSKQHRSLYLLIRRNWNSLSVNCGWRVLWFCFSKNLITIVKMVCHRCHEFNTSNKIAVFIGKNITSWFADSVNLLQKLLKTTSSLFHIRSHDFDTRNTNVAIHAFE